MLLIRTVSVNAEEYFVLLRFVTSREAMDVSEEQWLHPP